jgi:serine/threonine protein phosphatase PrpC
VKSPPSIVVSGAVITHRGQVRDQNEDAALFGDVFANTDFDKPLFVNLPDRGHWIVAVADGIGGGNAGSIASRLLVEWLQHYREGDSLGIVQFLKECNLRLFELGRENPNWAGLGAAVSGIVHGSEGLFAFNVGDCRVYRLRDGFLELITHDDSMAQVFVDAGLADREAIRDAKMHGITQAVGGRMERTNIEPHLYSLRVASNSRFLICTDGLTDMVDLDGMEAAMHTAATPEVAVAALFDLSISAGGKDNITIIVADIGVETGENING